MTLERLVLMALALIGASAVFMANSYGDGTAHGGNLMPMLAGGISTLLALAALLRSFPRTEADSEVGVDADYDLKASAWRPWAVLAGTAVFLVTMPLVGYPVAAPLWVAATMMVLGARNPVTIAGTSAALSIIAYLLLAKLAFAPPPMGLFGD